MVQFLSINFFSWISSIFVGVLKSSRFFVSLCIRIEKQASDIFCSIRRSGISCDNRHLCESNWTLHSTLTCVSKKIYVTRTDEWHTAWINPRVPSLGVDTEIDFHPVVSSIHRTYEADKIRSLYLSTGRAPTHTRYMDITTLHQENHVDIIGLPPHNSYKMQPLDKAFMGPL